MSDRVTKVTKIEAEDEGYLVLTYEATDKEGNPLVKTTRIYDEGLAAKFVESGPGDYKFTWSKSKKGAYFVSEANFVGASSSAKASVSHKNEAEGADNDRQASIEALSLLSSIYAYLGTIPWDARKSNFGILFDEASDKAVEFLSRHKGGVKEKIEEVPF